jgi:hypothetical protein
VCVCVCVCVSVYGRGLVENKGFDVLGERKNNDPTHLPSHD